MRVFELLEERRQRMGYTHAEMCRVLSMNRRMWDYVRFGKRNFGLQSYMLILKAYPDLESDIMREMLSKLLVVKGVEP